ncbi:MAG: PilZ domain-containing protein [Myxococcota bacterium]
MGTHETLMGMMGERRLTGRVETRWQAAVFHPGCGRLWVADVTDVSVSGLCLVLAAPIVAGDALELSLRDARGRQAQVTGSVTYAPAGYENRLGVVLTRIDTNYIDLVVQAFQADILAAQRPGRQVDFGLAEVTPLPRKRPSVKAGEWRIGQLADVIPYRRAVDLQTILQARARGLG